MRMERNNKSKKYNEDFKKTVMDLFGASEVTIYKWIKDFTPIWKGEIIPHS
ncbi:hypothetical protein bcgnr5410_56920 [Bacillus cereus]